MSENEASITQTPPATPTTSHTPGSEDAELKAINAMVAALGPLKDEQRLRAIEYVLRRFNAVTLQAPPVASSSIGYGSIAAPPAPSSSGTPSITDIRTLKEQKGPKTANEMATLVAYYVSELAPPTDRRAEISTADVERYFKMAGFKLPADARFTLVNARNAGYLDSAGNGQYKLNPVGYNLVVHRMGKADEGRSEARRRPRATRKKGAKNASRSKK
jgi:hypothetical protein